MVSDRKLSYSGYQTYMTCPKKYDLHYNEKIRPEYQPFHLLFGSAVDKALNALLESLKKVNLEFDDEFKEQQIRAGLNLASKELFKLISKKYSFEQKDFDGEILTDITIPVLLTKLKKVGWQGNDVLTLGSQLFEKTQFGDELSSNQTKALKYLVIASSVEKINLILESYFDYIVPQINEIISVQKNVTRGILDFEAKLVGRAGIVVCDNKTASRDYDPDAVLNSVQLAGYGAKIGAYIVFNKTVRKNRVKICGACGKNGTGQRHKTCDALVNGSRCNGEWVETVTPEVIPQLLVNEIPEQNIELVETAYCNTEKLIGSKVFPRNLSNCGKQYGQPCPYINLCWKGDKTGLKKEK